MAKCEILYNILIIMSLVMSIIGGLSDFTGKRYIISKDHYWRDSIYLLVLAIAIKKIYD